MHALLYSVIVQQCFLLINLLCRSLPTAVYHHRQCPPLRATPRSFFFVGLLFDGHATQKGFTSLLGLDRGFSLAHRSDCRRVVHGRGGVACRPPPPTPCGGFNDSYIEWYRKPDYLKFNCICQQRIKHIIGSIIKCIISSLKLFQDIGTGTILSLSL